MSDKKQGFIETPEPVATEVTDSIENVLRAMLGLDDNASYKDILKAAKKVGKKNGNGQSASVDQV